LQDKFNSQTRNINEKSGLSGMSLNEAICFYNENIQIQNELY
jgi:hypothetical protein